MADYSRDFHVAYGASPRSATIRFRCFDVPNSVRIYSEELDPRELERLLLSAKDACLDMHLAWSFSLPGSDISRLNAAAGRVEVAPVTAELVAAMKAFHESEPAFDFTIGPASFLWKRARRVPSQVELAEAMSHVGADKVALAGDVVLKADPLAQVDVGGAAKGFAADLLAKVLREEGVTCADIDLGGNLFMLGEHPQGRPWRVSVRMPEGVAASPVVVEVRDGAAVTSGSYERFVEIGGKRYQHIIDARTGWPSESDIVSATVFSESALTADLLATTACLLGSGGLPALAARHPRERFVAVTAEGEILRFGEPGDFGRGLCE